MVMTWSWLLVPLTPLLAVLGALCVPARAWQWLWLGCLPAALMAWLAPPTLELPWLWPGAQLGTDDILTRSWLGFSAVLWGAASVFAGPSLHRCQRRFWLFWQLSLSGNLLLIVAADGISFFVGFSVMSLAAYGLVVHDRGDFPRRAGRVYLQLAVVAEMLLYAGLVWRINEAGGNTAFATWAHTAIGTVTAFLLMLGLGLKAGFWPLHVWLPLAHPAAPAAASAVLSGAMIKAGILGLWRFFPEGGPAVPGWSEWLLAIALISVFYGVAAGLVQSTAKTVLAYSSVSQMGYLLAILTLAWSDPAQRNLWMAVLAAYGVHHGLAKGALFLGAGLASQGRLRPCHWLLMAIPALALAGLPLTSGALAKLLFKDGFAQSAWAQMSLMLSVGACATTLVALRAVWLMYQNQKEEKLWPGQLYPWLLLAGLPLITPWLWPDHRELMRSHLSPAYWWPLMWPIAVALLASLTALWAGRHLKLGWRTLPNPALALSSWLARQLDSPPHRVDLLTLDREHWRTLERRWNRFWQKGTVTISAWLLCLLLLLGWLW